MPYFINDVISWLVNINVQEWTQSNTLHDINVIIMSKHRNHVYSSKVFDELAKPGTHSTNYFPSQSNSLKISFSCHPNSNNVIATKFCTWHDSCAVVACANFFNDITTKNEISEMIYSMNFNCDGKGISEISPWQDPISQRSSRCLDDTHINCFMK